MIDPFMQAKRSKVGQFVPNVCLDFHVMQVLIRSHPLHSSKTLQGYNRCIKQEISHSLTWLGSLESPFTFDHVACETVTQEMLFNVPGLPMVDNCISGYNSCMFAYGQVLIQSHPLYRSKTSLQGYSRCIKQEISQSLTWLGSPESRFTFDHVACETVTQEILFNVPGLPMEDNCISGYNSCMFAYGQGSIYSHIMNYKATCVQLIDPSQLRRLVVGKPTPCLEIRMTSAI